MKEMPIQTRLDLIAWMSNIRFPMVNTLYLQANDIEIQRFMPALKNILPNVKLQIYLKGFMMSANNFKLILELSHNVQELVLSYWSITAIDGQFELDLNLDYRIESLNLYGTLYRFNKEALNEKKLDKLLATMAKTNLQSSLIQVGTLEKWYPCRYLQESFDAHGFNVVVSSTREEPSEVS